MCCYCACSEEDTVFGIATIPLSPLVASNSMNTWASVFSVGQEPCPDPTTRAEEKGEILVKVHLEDKGVKAIPNQEAIDGSLDLRPLEDTKEGRRRQR